MAEMSRHWMGASIPRFSGRGLKTVAIAVLLSLIASSALLSQFALSCGNKKLAPQTASSLPSLEGDQAIAHLKEQGLYQSLGEALQAARYSINPVPQPEKFGFDAGARYAENPAQNFQAFFEHDEIRLTPKGRDWAWQTGMRLVGYGYGERLIDTGKAEVKAERGRIEYHRAGLVEWYENRPEGLEQGFTIARAPMERNEGERLVVALDLTGDLQARVNESGQAMTLRKGGASLLSYDKLVAFDARGRTLDSRMRVEGRRVFLEVDDAGAVYPVTIDPILFFSAKVGRSRSRKFQRIWLCDRSRR